MMRSISLIHAIILLDKSEILKRPRNCKSQEIDYFERTKKNVLKAKKLVAKVIGRDRCHLPLQAKVLLLLIEQMVEKKPGKRKQSEHQFSWESIQEYAEWSERSLKVNIARLEKMKYLVSNPQKQLFLLLQKGRPVGNKKYAEILSFKTCFSYCPPLSIIEGKKRVHK